MRCLSVFRLRLVGARCMLCPPVCLNLPPQTTAGSAQLSVQTAKVYAENSEKLTTAAEGVRDSAVAATLQEPASSRQQQDNSTARRRQRPATAGAISSHCGSSSSRQGYARAGSSSRGGRASALGGGMRVLHVSIPRHPGVAKMSSSPCWIQGSDSNGHAATVSD